MTCTDIIVRRYNLINRCKDPIEAQQRLDTLEHALDLLDVSYKLNDDKSWLFVSRSHDEVRDSAVSSAITRMVKIYNQYVKLHSSQTYPSALSGIVEATLSRLENPKRFITRTAPQEESAPTPEPAPEPAPTPSPAPSASPTKTTRSGGPSPHLLNRPRPDRRNR